MTAHDSVWFWALVALIWLRTGARSLGAPWNMILHSLKDEATAQDLASLVRINSQDYVSTGHNPFLWAFITCVMTSLGLLGFGYGLEYAQAAFLLCIPIVLSWALQIRAAGRYLQARPEGQSLFRFLRNHRWALQIVTISWLFFVSLWGSVQTVLHSTFL